MHERFVGMNVSALPTTRLNTFSPVDTMWQRILTFCKLRPCLVIVDVQTANGLRSRYEYTGREFGLRRCLREQEDWCYSLHDRLRPKCRTMVTWYVGAQAIAAFRAGDNESFL
jgi:hypothetical protein